jgi:DMSO/TMAO reductase YedYZ heme-binding membrane subunit
VIQIYLLSVLCNLVAGFLFLYGDAFGGRVAEGEKKHGVFSGAFMLVVGVASILTGFLKLLTPIGSPAILGDLLPALTGMASGFMLTYSFYRDRNAEDGERQHNSRLERIGEDLLKYKRPIGIACIVVATLHFILPRALFL